MRHFLKNGLEIDDFFETRTVPYPYFGQLKELNFLKRLYDLKGMLSNDSRYENAERDIWQNTVNNDDYPDCWFFGDERFYYKNGDN